MDSEYLNPFSRSVLVVVVVCCRTLHVREAQFTLLGYESYWKMPLRHLGEGYGPLVPWEEVMAVSSPGMHAMCCREAPLLLSP